jgi:hypothetical protein
MKKYLYFALAIMGLSFILAIPSHASISNLAVTTTDVPSLNAYPNQWDVLVMDFTLKPIADDVLTDLTIKTTGVVPDSYIEEIRLYADNGDGIFQGWMVDNDLGTASWTSIYGSPLWKWQDLNIAVSQSGRHFFITLKIASDNKILYNSKSLQIALLQLSDANSDGIYNPSTDMGIYMNSKNNGPQSDIVNNGVITIVKVGIDTLNPESVITNPYKDEKINTKQYNFRGYTRDQGDGYLDKVFVTIKNEQNDLLVDKSLVNITDLSAGKWEYNYNFTIDGKYTIIAQGLDGIGHLETPGDSVTFTIGTAVVPPVTPPTTGKSYTYGDLIKAYGATVYYFGQDGKRYVFPNSATYYSWYPDFSGVKTTTDADLGSIAIGGNVTYKPGVKLVKITTDPKVYAVAANGTLRWVSTEAIAVCLYGANWGALVEDLSDAFFAPPTYNIGAPINACGDFNVQAVKDAALSIGVDKRL